VNTSPEEYLLPGGISINALPKISLHDHLDGGLRPGTIIELAEAIGFTLPTTDESDLGKWFADQANSGSLVEYLKTFDITCAVMQTEEGLTRVAREFVEDLVADGVIYGEVRWAPEQHLTRGLTLDQTVEAVQAGIEAGIRSFDGSLSGLGGCPFAPGATGNICTEDMVNMLEDMGYDTRVDLAKLLAVARRMPDVVGHEVPGQVMKAGQTLELHDPPEFLRP